MRLVFFDIQFHLAAGTIPLLIERFCTDTPDVGNHIPDIGPLFAYLDFYDNPLCPVSIAVRIIGIKNNDCGLPRI